MTDKGFNTFDEFAARFVRLFPHEEESTSSSWWDSKMYTSSSIANSLRMLTEIDKSGAIPKIKIWRWYFQTLNISLLILSWWCFSCLHIQRICIQIVYRSVVLKNNNLGTVDIIFINKLQFLTFSFLWFRKLIQVHG